MATANNIVVGGAKVYVRDASTAATSFIGSNGATEWGDLLGTESITAATNVGTDVGFTSEGIDLSFEPEYQDVQVDQLLDAAIIFKTSQRVSFKTTLAEATLTNFARAIGQDPTTTVADFPNSNSDSENVLSLRGGSLGEFPQEVGLVAIANGPRNTLTGSVSERVFEAFRAISVESVGVPIKRNETTVFPVSFRCLPDSSGNYMKIADRIHVPA